MEVSRHKSVDTLRGYVRRADLFKDHAGPGFCERYRSLLQIIDHGLADYPLTMTIAAETNQITLEAMVITTRTSTMASLRSRGL